MSKRTRILITGGGTGGHVYPGLATAEALQLLTGNVDIAFAGSSSGIESTLVPAAGFRLYHIPASGFRGMGLLARLRFVLNFTRGILRTLLLLIRWRPAVVLGTGGYVSAPVMAAARLLKIPCCLQEQNAIPGSTNRLVGRWASRIYLGVGAAAKYFKADRCVTTGNPVRAAFLEKTNTTEQSSTAGPGSVSSTNVLIFGGSRGAHTLNKAAAEAALIWLQNPNLALWIQTGTQDHQLVAEAFIAADKNTVQVVPYIDDMPAALNWANLVVCRAGAMTLAELQLIGKPSVLVPFPHATDNHQLKNAEACVAAGAAVVLEDRDCTGEALAKEVQGLLDDPQRLTLMSAAARVLGSPDAALTIAADLLDIAGNCAGLKAERQVQA